MNHHQLVARTLTLAASGRTIVQQLHKIARTGWLEPGGAVTSAARSRAFQDGLRAEEVKLSVVDPLGSTLPQTILVRAETVIE